MHQASEMDGTAPQSEASRKMRTDVEALRQDIGNLASSVSQLASETVGAAVGDAQAMGERKLSDLETAVRHNPTQAAMIAVGLGFVLGLVLTR